MVNGRTRSMLQLWIRLPLNSKSDNHDDDFFCTLTVKRHYISHATSGILIHHGDQLMFALHRWCITHAKIAFLSLILWIYADRSSCPGVFTNLLFSFVFQEARTYLWNQNDALQSLNCLSLDNSCWAGKLVIDIECVLSKIQQWE